MQNRSLRILAPAALALFVVGCRNIEPAPPPDAPRIEAFTASASRISPGQQVTFSFTTVGATKVELTDDAGNDVTLGGSVEAGTATVAPTRSSFYVLRATGAGGRDVAFLQIAVNEALKEVFLLAVPATITAGQEAQLLWGAPGATSVTLTTGAGAPQTLTGTTGAITVTPAFSEHYTLSAEGAPGTPKLTALADVQVRPVLQSADLTAADGVAPMKTVKLSWRSAGADRIVVSEQTFGQLTTVTEPSSVVSGSFDFVVPDTLPSGIAVTDGLPLRFVVTAASGAALNDAKVLNAVVGDRPTIEVFDAPTAASTGRTFSLHWRTLNATRVEVRVNGLPIWATLPTELARAAEGTVNLPAPSALTSYSFVASNDRGANTARSFDVRPVGLPVINTFTLTPTVNQLGDNATATWTTTDATTVQLSLENGPTLLTITTPSTVASGNKGIALAGTTRVMLTAFNAAGDKVTQSKPFSFNGAVVVSPAPVLRGTPTTLSWALSAGGVQEVVGLPTPMPAAVNASVAFVDLSTRTSARELVFADPVSGLEALPLPVDFHFPLLGRLKNELFVGVDGYLVFSRAALSGTNADLTATGSTAPTLLAPFWDDLVLTGTSKVLVDVLNAATGERFAVVQWHKVQIAGDGASELTFQVHLYESGQVAFLYKTVTGTLTSATIGVRDTSWGVNQQYAFNSTTTQPVPDLELNFFSGAPADGNVVIPAATSGDVTFFGRTATALLSATGTVRTFGPGDLSVSEAMPLPDLAATSGQWFELKNNQASTIDFGGLVVSSPTSLDGGFIIPEGTFVDAGALLVLGQSTDTQLNGGAPVSLVADDVPLAVPGSVAVKIFLSDAGTSTLSTLGWDAGTALVARSVAPVEGLLVASGSTFTCARTATFGPNGALGTPGLKNESCAPYVMSSIAGAFRTAPAGTEFTIGGTTTGDDAYVNTTLLAPFTYFGTAGTTVGISTNGFITLSGTLSSSYLTNDSTPSTSTPNGVVAVFWDDLVRDTGKSAQWREADRTIISWENYRLVGQTAASSVINAQVHLLDNGTLEFHYGAISTTSTSQSTIDRHFGNSATVWLERQDGAIAVPWSINTANGIAPNSGIRFTPVP